MGSPQVNDLELRGWSVVSEDGRAQALVLAPVVSSRVSNCTLLWGALVWLSRPGVPIASTNTTK
jgi:hypothetical protein